MSKKTEQSDNRELNELLSKSDGMASPTYKSKPPHAICDAPCDEEPARRLGNLVQWTSGDDKKFFPASKTTLKLVPGVYEINHSPSCGYYFEKIPVKTEGLLRFPETNSDRVINEIQNFWTKEEVFRKHKISYKRGIILWGPAGGGKTSTIQLIMRDIVERKGIVVKFTNPGVFLEGMRILREIEKDTPVVILMEDIDSILDCYNESEVLNILDGVDQIQKVCFLATTNYPENLGARILNRPSRFDKRFKIGYPNEESRRMYLEYILGEDSKVDIDKWVEDTDKFTIAHLKELFVAVMILGDDYEEAIDTLRSMREFISSDQDRDTMMGFAQETKANYKSSKKGIRGIIK